MQYLYKLYSRFLSVLPFLISLIALMFVHRFLGNSSVALITDRSGIVSLTSIVVVSFVISILPSRIQYYSQICILIIAFILDSVEILLAVHFNMSISPNVFQLLIETNKNETLEFIQTYVLSLKTIYVLLWYLCTLFICITIYIACNRLKERLLLLGKIKIVPILWGVALSFSIGWQITMIPYYNGIIHLLAVNNLRSMESAIIEHMKGGWIAYYPFLRLVYSIKSTTLIGEENELLLYNNQNVTISSKPDSNSTPIILFYLGESAIKRHSQHYGYTLPVSPYTIKEQQAGRLFVFNDAITLKNQTSFVIKSILSPNKSGERHWNEVPLLPNILRKGGYKTCFYSNQFVSQNSDAFAFIGGNFLNDPRINKLLFDKKNDSAFTYDDELATLVENELKKSSTNLFILFQGLGQHVNFSSRFPLKEVHFDKSHYTHRNDLSDEQKQIIADYDNATRYVDKVMYRLINALKEKNAILVYISDHGEEIFDETHKIGRQHSLTPDVIRSEYEVPMWLWCSDTYKKHHQDVVAQIQQAIDKPFTIDDISHLILGLSGIQCEYYNPKRDLLSPLYQAPTKRGVGFDGFRYNGYYEDIMSKQYKVQP